MEQAGLSVESGPLDPANALGLDSNFELDTDGFDFAPDGTYDYTEQAVPEGLSRAAEDPSDDPRLSDAGEGTHSGNAVDEQPEPADEGADNVDHSAEAYAEDQDEIGYEEDDLGTTEINADTGATEPAESVVELPFAQAQDQPESAEVDEGGHAEPAADEERSSWQEGVDTEQFDEDFHLEHESDNAGEETTDGIENYNRTIEDPKDETLREQRPPGYQDGYPDKESVDLARPLTEVPDIQVLYDEGCYALFGTSEENPDSYFLSEVDLLDRPLSQFLSALRAVIAEDLTPTDELVIRFDPLELEFGERSNDKFLNRSLREILDCHKVLCQVPDVSADAVIHLIVRRDIEAQFLELLADAELVRNRRDPDEDSDMSDFGSESRLRGANEPQMEHEPPASGSSDGLEDEDNHNPSTTDIHDDSSGHATNERNEFELDIASGDNDETKDQEGDRPAGASASSSPSLLAENGLAVEEGSRGVSPEPNPAVLAEHGADGEQVWDEIVSEGDAAASQRGEGSPEALNEQSHAEPESQHGDESANSTGTLEVGETTTTGNNSSEQETGLNGKYAHLISPIRGSSSSIVAPAQHGFWEIDYSDDEFETTSGQELESAVRCVPCAQQQKVSTCLMLGQSSELPTAGLVESSLNMTTSPSVDANKHAHQDDDLVLTFDEDAGTTGVHEQGDDYDEYTITYEASVNAAGDDGEAPDDHVAEIADETLDNTFPDGAYVAATAETTSVHTSTTVNGDEMSYGEQNVANESLMPAGDSVQLPTSVVASGSGNDEIDWENDEDLDELRVASGDDGVEDEEPQDAAQSPPSISGKRGRTDEVESLADETDHKRRRT